MLQERSPPGELTLTGWEISCLDMFARFAKSTDTYEKLEPESNSTRASTELTGRVPITTSGRPAVDDEGRV